MRGVLRHPQLDAAFKELMLTLPGESYIAEQLAVVDPQRVHAVREAMRQLSPGGVGAGPHESAEWAGGLPRYTGSPSER